MTSRPHTPPRLYILSYEIAQGILASSAASRITHVISINDPSTQPPVGLRRHTGEHLILRFHDIDEPFEDLLCPTEEDVQRIVEFGKLFKEEEHQMMVHCAGGVSRSAAAALIILAGMKVPSKNSAETSVGQLLKIKSAIRPNSLMIRFADNLLGYGGRLSEIVERTFGKNKMVLPELP